MQNPKRVFILPFPFASFLAMEKFNAIPKHRFATHKRPLPPYLDSVGLTTPIDSISLPNEIAPTLDTLKSFNGLAPHDHTLRPLESRRPLVWNVLFAIAQIYKSNVDTDGNMSSKLLVLFASTMCLSPYMSPRQPIMQLATNEATNCALSTARCVPDFGSWTLPKSLAFT